MNKQDEIILKQLQPYLTEEFLKSYDYHELNIENFIKTVFHHKVVEPLEYLLNVEPKVGVPYKKYLYVKAIHSKLKKHKKNLDEVQEYWNVWVKE
jgi:hypothetical protein